MLADCGLPPKIASEKISLISLHVLINLLKLFLLTVLSLQPTNSLIIPDTSYI